MPQRFSQWSEPELFVVILGKVKSPPLVRVLLFTIWSFNLPLMTWCVLLLSVLRSTTWLLWELYSGLLPGWGASYSGGHGAIFCAPNTPQAPAGPSSIITRGYVHHSPHAAPHTTSEGAQELLQWRHPAWLHWHRDTHLSHTVQRLHIFIQRVGLESKNVSN